METRRIFENEIKNALRMASSLTLPSPPHDPDDIISTKLAELFDRLQALEKRVEALEK